MCAAWGVAWRAPSWLTCRPGRGGFPRGYLGPSLFPGLVDTSPMDLVCSARGCGAGATWFLRWNNPKLHPPKRRKTWLACDEHLPSLTEFLQVRGFLRETESIGTPT